MLMVKNTKVVRGGELDVLPKGLSEQKIEFYGADKEQNYALLKTWVYEQPYSVVRGYFGYSRKDGNPIEGDGQNPEEIPFDLYLGDIRGVATDEDKLPKAGSFQYEGRAFGGNGVLSKESLDNHNGVFRYTIDFDRRKGSGSIEGMEQYGKIKLEEAAIERIPYRESGSSLGLKDRVSYFGVNEGVAMLEKDNEIKKYHLGIFGEAANEVAGAVSQEHKYQAVIGFGGEKK
ncbi:TPA: factor H binding protein domain-containing protein [Neisseria gonorrhoeae]